MSQKIIIVDDEESIISAFENFLASKGFDVFVAPTAEEGIKLAQEVSPQIVLMDVKLPGMNGIEATKKIKEIADSIKIIVITAHGTIETAIDAIKSGAVDYLTKPVSPQTLLNVINKALVEAPASKNIQKLRREIKRFQKSGIVGVSEAMNQIFKTVAKVIDTGSNVMIYGPSGSGKELIARSIHYNSNRSDKPFEAINCANIPDHLLESELFGHEKGAFTGAVNKHIGKFEIANRGTLFLDEIGELPSNSQAKMLRFIEERQITRVGGSEKIEIDIRLISATNSILEDQIKQGKFREDLYFRLNVLHIDIPPLYKHNEDIIYLIAYFLEKMSSKGITDTALDKLVNYHFPGNVRELKNILEQANANASCGVIDVQHLPLLHQQGFDKPETVEQKVDKTIDLLIDRAKSSGQPLFSDIESVYEKSLLKKVLDNVDGNQLKASRILGINRLTLRKKILKYNL